MGKLENRIIAAVLIALLSACGSTPKDRAIIGAGIGAGVGAVGGTLMGGDAVKGAVVGGVVGGAAGGLTKEKDINLGKPVWQ
jgi:hypothetical protein